MHSEFYIVEESEAKKVNDRLPEAGLSVWALPAAGPLNQLPQRRCA